MAGAAVGTSVLSIALQNVSETLVSWVDKTSRGGIAVGPPTAVRHGMALPRIQLPVCTNKATVRRPTLTPTIRASAICFFSIDALDEHSATWWRPDISKSP